MVSDALLYFVVNVFIAKPNKKLVWFILAIMSIWQIATHKANMDD